MNSTKFFPPRASGKLHLFDESERRTQIEGRETERERERERLSLVSVRLGITAPTTFAFGGRSFGRDVNMRDTLQFTYPKETH